MFLLRVLSGPTLWNFTFSHSFEGDLLSGSVHASKADELYLNTIPTGSLLVITCHSGWPAPSLFDGFGKEMLSGSNQSFKMDEPSLTTTSRRNLLAMGHRSMEDITFSHSFEVECYLVL